MALAKVELTRDSVSKGKNANPVTLILLFHIHKFKTPVVRLAQSSYKSENKRN